MLSSCSEPLIHSADGFPRDVTISGSDPVASLDYEATFDNIDISNGLTDGYFMPLKKADSHLQVSKTVQELSFFCKVHFCCALNYFFLYQQSVKMNL